MKSNRQKSNNYDSVKLPIEFDILSNKADTPFLIRYSSVLVLLGLFSAYLALVNWFPDGIALLCLLILSAIYFLGGFNRDVKRIGFFRFSPDRITIFCNNQVQEIELSQIKKLKITIGKRHRYGIESLNIEIIPNTGQSIIYHVDFFARESEHINIPKRMLPSLKDTLSFLNKKKMCVVQSNYY